MLGFFATVYDRTKQGCGPPDPDGPEQGRPAHHSCARFARWCGSCEGWPPRPPFRESQETRLVQGKCIPASMTTKAPGYALASFASSLRSLRIEPLFTTSPRVSSTQNVCLLSPRSRPIVACAFRSLRVVSSIRHRAYYPRTAASQGSLCLLI